MSYDDQNIFAKILRGEIPCDKVFEDDYCLAFNDISPQAPVHVLVIPKGRYVSFDDFHTNASDAEIAGYIRGIGTVARMRGVDADGYRIISNIGANGHQEVMHLHVHVVGGRPVGRMLSKPRD